MTKITKHNSLIIKGCRQNNLQSLSVEIPHDSFTVVTGVSGSGKSSLVFDTIYAEGQRRYVESLSAYARQFLGRMPKPELDSIEGLAPAIAIEQKLITRNPRSTVATTTELYDYLKILFVRFGTIYSPVTGEIVSRQQPDDVWKFIEKCAHGSMISILSKPQAWLSKHKVADELNKLKAKGFLRILSPSNEVLRLDKLVDLPKSLADYAIIIDRVVIDLETDPDLQSRAVDSIENAYWEGNGSCSLLLNDTLEVVPFNNSLFKDGIQFVEPDTNNMSFNSPSGACVTCGGLGEITDIDPDLVIPDSSLSVYDDCVIPWKGETMSQWKLLFMRKAIDLDFPIHRAYEDLTPEQQQLLWKGGRNFDGLHSFFKHLEEKSYKIQYRVMLSRYRGRTTCPDCKGTKLRSEAAYVKLSCKHSEPTLPNKISLHDILLMPVSFARRFFDNALFDGIDSKATSRVLAEIQSRLRFLDNVGLGYITLHRMSNTLSGGESQRVRLATSLGSTLTGSLYILDEPSIGLHPRDTQHLIAVLKELQAGGNTVLVVEHEEEMMRAADRIIDIGPGAGIHGGKLMFCGTHDELRVAENSLTADYLNGVKSVPLPTHRRQSKHVISIKGAKENNLKNIDVDFPLEILTVVTGVSGSGKTTLVKKILVPALIKRLGSYAAEKSGKFSQISGKLNLIKQVELIDQNPLGRSSRSNPVTYVKAWDLIRDLLADRATKMQRKYKASMFSFNVEGGRCEHCKGDGVQQIEMQFMADIVLPCEFCNGKRFKDEILEVTYKEKNVSEILDMSVAEAMLFFEAEKNIIEKLKPLEMVGLEYVKLGQSTGTLSGGEAQRVKLASFLGKGQSQEPIFFVFDEPTTGLHFHDIVKLIQAFQALVDKGHTIVVIEHNLDVIKVADHVIDLGPDGGDKGGHLVFAGTPEDLALQKESITGFYLKDKL